MQKSFLISVILFRLGLVFLKAGKEKLLPELEKIMGKEAIKELEQQFDINLAFKRLEEFLVNKEPAEQEGKKEERILH